MIAILKRYRIYFTLVLAVAVLSFNGGFDSNDQDYIDTQNLINTSGATVSFTDQTPTVNGTTVTFLNPGTFQNNQPRTVNPITGELSLVDTFTINAPGAANNGGSANWAMFLDLITPPGNGVIVTQMSTGNTGTAGQTFSVEVFTRDGTALGGPVGSGPGSSTVGWTSLGSVPVTQGAVGSGTSLVFNIPPITVAGNDTVGVAIKFAVVGPRYLGSGSPPYSVFSDASLTVVTGDGRSAPFTPTGSFFASRALTGVVRYVLNTPPPPAGFCEGFTGVTFPPTGWALTGAALLWSRNAVSGFGNGVGSAKADFYLVTGNQQLNSIVLGAPTVGGDSLIFQNAYCTFATENDQLQIQTSTNGGTTWVPLVTLNGGVAGQLVTAPPQTASFTPTAAQWKYQRLALPVGVNRIQFNAISAFGNNLYIDSICYKPAITGIVSNNTIAKEFSLSQNYPNPFNPTTNIKFGLPSAGNVKLVVFDILGREVTTLVNEYKTSGIYTVDFDASMLSSGVYFYRIESGDFVQTKKMLLVK